MLTMSAVFNKAYFISKLISCMALLLLFLLLPLFSLCVYIVCLLPCCNVHIFFQRYFCLDLTSLLLMLHVSWAVCLLALLFSVN